MPVKTRFQPIERSTLFQAADGLSGAAASKALAGFARTQIDAAEATNRAAIGRFVPYTTTVDGSTTTDLDRVRPDGTIVAEFDLGSDLLIWIFEQLRAHAPVRSGRFRDSIKIFADGEEVDDPATATLADEVVFVTLVPYGRKIERGESKSAPDGVFEAVASLASARYGNQARIKFSYREPTGGDSMLEQWAAPRAAAARRPHRQHARDARQPAIIVTFR